MNGTMDYYHLAFKKRIFFDGGGNVTEHFSSFKLYKNFHIYHIIVLRVLFISESPSYF